jgi:PAS domain-containing protein
VDEETGEVKDGQEDLEHSILRLENEMRLRSQRLTSSKVMSGFINEVLALVTSYSDRVRAKRICNEFLKDERSLKQTEKLLKQLAPTEEPKDCVERMRQLLVRGGVTEKALAEWLDGTAKKRAGAARPRPRRRAPAAVAEGITKRLAGLALDSARAQALTDDLSAFVEQRARERSADILEQVEDLRGSVSRRDRTLEGLAQGVVLWGSEGKVEYANATARRALGADAVPDLHPELRRALRELRFPLADPEPLASRAGLGQADVHLLMSIAAVLTEGEEPYAVLFVV